jgi:hypothetical protein
MKGLALCFTLLAALPSLAQQKIRTIETVDTIVFATVDRAGDVYLVLKNGQIQKFDKDGKLLIAYRHQGVPTLFDPRDGARLFAYYRTPQQYDYYNPSFETTASFRIDPAFAIDPWLICPSGDHKLWLLDAADHSLKKLNARHTEVEVEVTIDSTLIGDATTFTTMRDYQGFVFLLNPEKGIYIFNSLGKHIRTIPEKGIHHFNFLGEELYFLRRGQLLFFNLFSAESRQVRLESSGNMVVLTDERMFVADHRKLDIFEFRP